MTSVLRMLNVGSDLHYIKAAHTIHSALSHRRGDMYSCNLCEKSYEWKRGLQRHVRVKHSMQSPQPRVRPSGQNVSRRIRAAMTFTWSWQSDGNLRLWYNSGPDVEKPTRLGITLSEKQWSNLINISDFLALSYSETLRQTPDYSQSQ